MERYILNHYYILRHDTSRTFIMSSGNETSEKSVPVNSGWCSMIHPAYAMMLSFFSDPKELIEACSQISSFFSAPESVILSFLQSLVAMEEPSHATIDGVDCGFPINLMIPEDKEFTPKVRYYPKDFLFEELDLETARMIKAPISIVFMPNNNCLTSCIYCYADTKSRQSQLSFDKIESFVREARALKVRDILITGGDFFMYNQWRDLLTLLLEMDYAPDLISTKVPLGLMQIRDFSSYNIRLQISLDSVNASVASRVLSVPNCYVKRMQESILNIDKSPIRYQIATVLTRENDSILELECLSKFIGTLDRIERWEIRVAFKSLYSKTSFDEIKSKREQIATVERWIQKNKGTIPVEILWSPDDDWKYKKISGGSAYFEGDLCSANMTNMVVLPDGQVTICEQLYWTPDFIIGNINDSTIADIWSSEKAISLWKREQKSIKEDSPCRSCMDFQECFKASNRCYANIMKAYGMENFDYPDPRCLLAPNFIRTITHD